MKTSSFLGFMTGMLLFAKYSCEHKYSGNILVAMMVPEHVLVTLSGTNHICNHVLVLRFGYSTVVLNTLGPPTRVGVPVVLVVHHDLL